MPNAFKENHLSLIEKVAGLSYTLEVYLMSLEINIRIVTGSNFENLRRINLACQSQSWSLEGRPRTFLLGVKIYEKLGERNSECF